MAPPKDLDGYFPFTPSSTPAEWAKRAEQLRQALAANPEARYSMEELSIADAFEDLPTDMRKRLKGGERTGE